MVTGDIVGDPVAVLKGAFFFKQPETERHSKVLALRQRQHLWPVDLVEGRIDRHSSARLIEEVPPGDATSLSEKCDHRFVATKISVRKVNSGGKQNL